MTLDHVAWALFPGFSENALSLLAHTIGRISCPIFCYFVAEGFHRTRDVGKYAARIFAFALLSHFAYVFASDDFAGAASFLPFFRGRILNQTSVFWSLAWGLTMLRVNFGKIQRRTENISDRFLRSHVAYRRLELRCGVCRISVRDAPKRRQRRSARRASRLFVFGGLCLFRLSSLRRHSARDGVLRSAAMVLQRRTRRGFARERSVSSGILSILPFAFIFDRVIALKKAFSCQKGSKKLLPNGGKSAIIKRVFGA